MRYQYMDSLRGTLMICGILFHASIPYTKRTDWIISDPSGLSFFDWVGSSIHAFRMPTFFFVAGFFCAFSFARHELNSNTVRRLTALAVPTISVMFLLQPVQYLLALKFGGESPASLDAFLGSFVSSGSEIGHLWFLLFLMAYYVLTWLFLRFRGGVAPKHGDRIGHLVQAVMRSEVPKSKTVLAMACVCFTVALNFACRLDSLVPGLSVSAWVFYMPFFVVGYASHRHPQLLQQLASVSLLDVAALALLWSLSTSFDGSPHRTLRALLDTAVSYEAAWVIGMGTVWVFSRFVDVPSKTVRSVSDAAYTIYLFHHVLVIALVYALIGISVPGGPMAKYATVVIVAFAATLALHHAVIKRSVLLRFLFNGRLPDPRAAHEPRAAATAEGAPSRL